MVSFTSPFKTLLVVLPLALSAMGALPPSLPPSGTYQLFNPSTNFYLDVEGSNNATGTRLISFTHNTPNSVNQKFAVEQKTFDLGKFNAYIIRVLVPSSNETFVNVPVPIPAVGVGAVTNVSPTVLNVTEFSPDLYTLGITNTNLALQGGNASGQQVTAQTLNPNNTLQLWKFTLAVL